VNLNEGNGGEKPPAFTADDRGRGPTLDKAINDAVRKKHGQHGDVFEVKIYVSVSNPHVGEYIAELS
jgi:hypothetical protein